MGHPPPGAWSGPSSDRRHGRRSHSPVSALLRGGAPARRGSANHADGSAPGRVPQSGAACDVRVLRRVPGPPKTRTSPDRSKGRSPGSGRSGRAQGGLPDGVDGAGDIGRPEQIPPILRTVAPMHGVLCRPTLACGLVPGGPIFLRSPVVAKLRSARACGCAGRHTQRGGPAVAPRMSEIRRRPLSPRLPEVVFLGAFSTRARGPGPGRGRRARPFGPVCSPRPRGWPENLRMTSGHA